ncbi:serpin family protein [Streptomyces sp. NBC_00233]|uniref:serpin family protein n=1 Tax=Streptomyces sp. NBC_00233 TaxID=2975686 RepID=UPI002256DEC8|nr:serpin family protein [Streptomyces sp. NBC_00233]MCX5225961.1 serpin family protein [Streptomyces sp. NBC_00233]
MTPGPTAFEADAVRALAARWLPCLGEDDFVCSPVGLWLALVAVASGARGRTAEELRELLGVDGETAAGAVAAAGRRLAVTDGVVSAAGVWSRVPVLDAFRRGLPDVEFGVLRGAPAWFELPDEVLGATDDVSLGEIPAVDQDELDGWIRRATGGRVQRLPLGLDGSEDLVLVNALVLKASWLTAFPAQLTRDEPFTDGSGATRPVPTMRQRIPAGRVWSVDGVTVVELPCAGDEAARVRFALGRPGAGPAEVLPAAWAGPAERQPLAADAADLLLPRFTLRTKTEAEAHLASLGISRALRPGADFSGLSPAGLFVSKVVQETLVEVAEEGVEAAAVTQVTMTRSAAVARHRVVERVAFDRPFGVVVLDASGELPLFAGWRRSAPDGAGSGAP